RLRLKRAPDTPPARRGPGPAAVSRGPHERPYRWPPARIDGRVVRVGGNDLGARPSRPPRGGWQPGRRPGTTCRDPRTALASFPKLSNGSALARQTGPPSREIATEIAISG